MTAGGEPWHGGGRGNSITPVDIDGDGDDDLVVANPGQNRLYLNTGGQSFADVTSWLPVDDDFTNDIAAVDVDGQKAIVFVGFGLAAQPLRLPPWGSFFLDLSVVVQAALLHAPSPLEWRFSNVLTAQR